MAVVTISREYGSAGSEVARMVAKDLGFQLLEKDRIGKILAGYGLVDFESTYEAETGIWSNFDTRLRTVVSMLEKIAYSVARRGHAVLLGRGAYAALAGKPDVLNVRIRAPFDWRIERLMREKPGLGFKDAEAEVREGDRVRSSFVSSVYGIRWDSMEGFDLVVDTSKIDLAMAASWIAQAAQDLPEESSWALKPEYLDSVLDEAVAAELGKS